MLKIDGVSYDVDVSVDELEESFEKLSADTSGRTQDGTMYIDIIGTFYNYSLTIRRKQGTDLSNYDALFEKLAEPVDFITLEVPHGQGTQSFMAYITSGSRKLLRQVNGSNYWGDITLKFVAKSPQRRP